MDNKRAIPKLHQFKSHRVISPHAAKNATERIAILYRYSLMLILTVLSKTIVTKTRRRMGSYHFICSWSSPKVSRCSKWLYKNVHWKKKISLAVSDTEKCFKKTCFPNLLVSWWKIKGIWIIFCPAWNLFLFWLY